MRIYEQRDGKLSDADRVAIAQLLIKAGYTVKIGREKKNPKSQVYTYFVEFTDKEVLING